MGGLSKTFSDAISLCGFWNIHYIWIDSLCIIQDPRDDCVRESATMRDVYRNYFCNIAATAAAESVNGPNLFIDRDPILITPLQVQFRWMNHKGPYYCFRTHLWKDNVEDTRLNKRAWVLQGRYLSPCTIYCGRQLSWECRELCACETYPRGKEWSSYHIDGKERSFKACFDDLGGDSPDYKTWTSVVNKYTDCGLTMERDKLVAISGMAKEMQALFSDTYLACLWRKHLYPNMLWHGVKRDPW
jgi:hypothetical protein